jgi:Tol biopolymer transport system component
MTAEGEGKRPLIRRGDYDGKLSGSTINPAYSPDGEKVAFATRNDTQDRRGDVYICDKDGSNVTRLTYFIPDAGASGDSVVIPLKKPFFSPDGTKILFAHTEPHNQHSWIYTVNVDGTDLTRLSDEDAYDVNPTFSPDGERILYFSSRSPKPPIKGSSNTLYHDGDIYIMNADGSGKTRLTDGESNYNFPAFSPDGDTITYLGGEDCSYSGSGDLFEGNIYLMDLATGESEAVLDEPGYVRPPTFVPDNCEMNAAVFTVFEDADNGVTLYLGSGDCSFSPDGKTFVSPGSIDFETLIFIIKADGSGEIQSPYDYPNEK